MTEADASTSQNALRPLQETTDSPASPQDQPDQPRALQGSSATPLAPPQDALFHRCAVIQCPYLIALPADGILVAWLDDKTGKSHSWKTHVAYHATALSLRAALQVHGYELFCDLTDDTHYAAFLLIVQQWAGARAADSHHRGPISPATYNHRLATISSLYDYARRRRLYRGDNPIEAIDRRAVGDQQGASAVDALEMRKRLSRIPRTTPAGQRDYALLSVALHTAQRVRALAAMRVGDLAWSGERLILHFPRTKGGHTDERELETGTSKALSDYLCSLYGERWHEQRHAPVWVSFARNGSRGKQLSVQALEQICLKYIGTSAFHTMRHTAGITLEDLGATTSEIQAFLRHKNIATTSRYLKRARRAKNKYGHDLEQIFGIQGTPEQGGGA